MAINQSDFDIGSLSSLKTTDRTSLVAAINELFILINGRPEVNLTQAEYDSRVAAGTIDPNTQYNIVEG